MLFGMLVQQKQRTLSQEDPVAFLEGFAKPIHTGIAGLSSVITQQLFRRHLFPEYCITG